MFISVKRFLHVTVGWRNQRIWVLRRSLGGSTNRAHNVVLLTKNEIDIRSLELEATSSRAINGSLKVRVGVKTADLGTLSPIHNRVYGKEIE